MDKAEVEKVTSELEALLLPGNSYQATVIRQLREYVASDELTEAKRLFVSLEMWGGSGSVADVSLSSPAANERMNELLVQLAQHFEEAGITCPRGTRWVSVFRMWHQQGVFR